MLDDKLKKLLAVSGLGLLSLSSAAILYYLLKSENEEEGYLSTKVLSGSQQITIRVPVPKDVVGAVIGRQGSVIKALQEKTNTRIRFDDKSATEEAERIVIIRGSAEAAQEAETLIRSLIVEQPELFAEEIYIPVRACGRIIGKNGDNIRHMSYVSMAKIIVDRSGNDRDPDNMKRVTIRGTRDQIDMAIHMIDEKLAEEEAFRQKIELSSAGRPSRYRGKPLSIEASSADGAATLDDSRMQEKLIPNAADGFLEVYISAVNTPGQFWVQLVGVKAIELDKLVEDMTDFYNDLPNQDLMRLCEVTVGTIVAAPFAPDKCWYRGRVVAVEEDDYDASQSKLTVHYVDFGDAIALERQAFCQLKPDFLTVPFQAIECQLASVKPIDGLHWSTESTDIFEVLTYSAQWKVIMAKPVACLKKDTSSSVYVVELVDTSGHTDVKVAEELVKRKFAMSDTGTV